MNKTFLSLILGVLLCAAPIALAVLPRQDVSVAEKRKLATPPAWPEQFGARPVRKYFAQWDSYLSDHFPMRHALLTVASAMIASGGGDIHRTKCYRGRENWLFLGNDYSSTVDKLTGVVVPQPEAVAATIGEYAARVAASEKIGAKFTLFIGPNKSSVYPEFLPPSVIPAEKPYIAPFVEGLKAEGITVYDPTALLRKTKDKGLLYSRTDTHWSLLGASVAFTGFLDMLNLPVLPPYTLHSDNSLLGDLVSIGGYTSFPLSPGDLFELTWQTAPSLEDKDGGIVNRNSTSGKTAWVFADSFGWQLRQYFSATFKQTRFFSHKEYGKVMESAGESPPDLVVWVTVERDL